MKLPALFLMILALGAPVRALDDGREILGRSPAFEPRNRPGLLGTGDGETPPTKLPPTPSKPAPRVLVKPAPKLPPPPAPAGLDRARAERILRACGFYADRILAYHRRRTPGVRDRFGAALAALAWGKTYRRPRGPVPFDARSKAWILAEGRKLVAARRANQGSSEISVKATPDLLRGALVAAASHLTGVRSELRVPLLRSLLIQESARVHWRAYVPVVSHAGAIGLGQLLPRTADRIRINPYDPRRNLEGVARYLQALHGRAGSVRLALARYNGGDRPPASSFRYADAILARVRAAPRRPSA